MERSEFEGIEASGIWSSSFDAEFRDAAFLADTFKFD
tara:strand:+ start:1550 stop:1660 length:111 start_codon:yes stop_codon:yes gene_type:complete